MNVLALDLGTKCGWAARYIQSGGRVHIDSGVWDLKPSKHESIGQRFVKFKRCLQTNSDLWDLVVYEEVRYHRAIDAGHVYGGLVAVLQTFLLEREIPYYGIGVTTLKKHATGHHLAKKELMVSTAIKHFPKIHIIDDNHADALWLLDHAITHHIE